MNFGSLNERGSRPLRLSLAEVFSWDAQPPVPSKKRKSKNALEPQRSKKARIVFQDIFQHLLAVESCADVLERVSLFLDRQIHP